THRLLSLMVGYASLHPPYIYIFGELSQMFGTDIKPISIRTKSLPAESFNKKFRSLADQIRQEIKELPLSVLIWASRELPHLPEFKEELSKLNIDVTVSIRKEADDTQPLTAYFKEKSKEVSIIYAIAVNDYPLFRELTKLRRDLGNKFFIFTDEETEARHIKAVRHTTGRDDIEEIFKKNGIFRFPNTSDHRVLNAIEYIRTLKYMRPIFVRSEYVIQQNISIPALYQNYKAEFDIFLHDSYLFFLAFFRYLTLLTKDFLLTKDSLLSHLIIPANDLEEALNYFKGNGFVTEESPDQYKLSDAGRNFFDMFQLKSLPILEDEKRVFKDRWAGPVSTTSNINSIFGIGGKLNGLSKALYMSMARQHEFHRSVRYFLYESVPWPCVKEKCLTPEEKEFLEYCTTQPKMQSLFEIWRENIGGVKQMWQTEEREYTEFLKYVFERLRIRYEPEQAQKHENFKNLAFSLRMQRPGNQAHIYLSFSFLMRPLKKFIKQYFDMAFITGEYDLLLKRYPPYWNLLILYAGPGERTLIDMRGGLDIPIITYRLDYRYNLALHMSDVQSRKAGRLISCPIETDKQMEREKEAEVSSLENEMNNSFPSPAYLGNIDFGDDGLVYFLGKEKEVVPMYGMRRGFFIQARDLLKLVKANPRPGPKSGLIIRFNLLHPITVLINGINGHREMTMDEMLYALKFLDMQGTGTPDEVVDKIFREPDPGAVKGPTRGFIRELERLRAEDPSDEKAWRFLTARLLEGKYKDLLQSICHCLMADAFELTFALLPLIMGKDIKLDTATGKVEITDAPKKGIYQFPLLDNLKRELEDLLKDVFSKYVDVSAATKKARSEPMLTEMIIDYCLKIKSDPEAFRARLKAHIKKHRTLNKNFMAEFMPTIIPPAEMNYNIAEMKINVTEKFPGPKPPGPDKEEEKPVDSDKEKKTADSEKKKKPVPPDPADADVDGIMKLIHDTRNRLLSPGENTRLLRFIDPESIEIQIGNFKYGGTVNKEAKFLGDKVALQLEYALKSREYDYDTTLHIKKIVEDIEEEERNRAEYVAKKKIAKEKELREKLVKGGKKKKDFEKTMIALRAKEDREKEFAKLNTSIAKIEAESQREIGKANAESRREIGKANAEAQKEIARAQMEQAFNELKLKAFSNLKSGNLKEYALLALIQAHQQGGIEAIERLLGNSPILMTAINPELQKMKSKQALKMQILEFIKQNKPDIDPRVLAALFSEEFKEVMRSDIYKEMNKILTELLKKTRFHGNQSPSVVLQEISRQLPGREDET
ncbi:hypothetical protein QUF80_12250, partial [Desulfococcaceae bacterium HSG8]|nr:hypothetical protein [Desulfococcaceae bacterium HSG8]